MHRLFRAYRNRTLAAPIAVVLAGLAAYPAASHAATIVVANCNNTGAGSLRNAVAIAASGDTIDLGSLSCSRIVLGGSIAVPQTNLTILGRDRTALTIDGNHVGRVLTHTGTGTLGITAVTLTNGRVVGANAIGGCVRSTGNVRLSNARVHRCLALGQGGLNPWATGGGIHADRDVAVTSSSVYYNVADSYDGEGGGINADGRLTLNRSQLYGNQASNGGGARAGGGLTAIDSLVHGNTAWRWDGGISAQGNVIVLRSTFSANNGGNSCGGLCVGGDGTKRITDSTISGNIAQHYSAASLGGSASIYNSTIAFNREETWPGDDCWGALGGRFLTLRSSIVAANTCAGLGPVDIGGDAAFGDTLAGADNLINSSALPVPPDTISGNPRLAWLANNGGPTRTHALLADSPAINRGSNPLGLAYDQRGPGFPRLRGAFPDIGALER